jgi:hypothetical protein
MNRNCGICGVVFAAQTRARRFCSAACAAEKVRSDRAQNMRRRRADNPDRCRDYWRRYRADNKEAINARRRELYRAKQKGSGGQRNGG